MLAVSEHLFGQVDEKLVRASTGFGGGVAGARQELCGALSGGILIIGALHGRVRADEDDKPCYGRVARYQERFVREFGATRCYQLREDKWGPEKTPCSILVEQATQILLKMLTEG